MNHIKISIHEPIRLVVSYEERIESYDYGVINAWEVGRKLALTNNISAAESKFAPSICLVLPFSQSATDDDFILHPLARSIGLVIGSVIFIDSFNLSDKVFIILFVFLYRLSKTKTGIP